MHNDHNVMNIGHCDADVLGFCSVINKMLCNMFSNWFPFESQQSF